MLGHPSCASQADQAPPRRAGARVGAAPRRAAGPLGPLPRFSVAGPPKPGGPAPPRPPGGLWCRPNAGSPSLCGGPPPVRADGGADAPMPRPPCSGESRQVPQGISSSGRRRVPASSPRDFRVCAASSSSPGNLNSEVRVLVSPESWQAPKGRRGVREPGLQAAKPTIVGQPWARRGLVVPPAAALC